MGFAEGETRVDVVVEEEVREALGALVASTAVGVTPDRELATVGIVVAIRTASSDGARGAPTRYGRLVQWLMASRAIGLRVGTAQREARPLEVVEPIGEDPKRGVGVTAGAAGSPVDGGPAIGAVEHPAVRVPVAGDTATELAEVLSHPAEGPAESVGLLAARVTGLALGLRVGAADCKPGPAIVLESTGGDHRELTRDVAVGALAAFVGTDTAFAVEEPAMGIVVNPV